MADRGFLRSSRRGDGQWKHASSNWLRTCFSTHTRQHSRVAPSSQITSTQHKAPSIVPSVNVPEQQIPNMESDLRQPQGFALDLPTTHLRATDHLATETYEQTAIAPLQCGTIHEPEPLSTMNIAYRPSPKPICKPNTTTNHHRATNPPYHPAELAYLTYNFNGEAAFLASYDLSIFLETDRDKGKEILQHIMRHDQTIARNPRAYDEEHVADVHFETEGLQWVEDNFTNTGLLMKAHGLDPWCEANQLMAVGIVSDELAEERRQAEEMEEERGRAAKEIEKEMKKEDEIARRKKETAEK